MPGRLAAMPVPDMFRLRSIQPKILYSVVTRVAVYVVDDLARFKIAAQVLLHNVAVFKDVLELALLMLIGWIRMIVRGHNKRISIFSDFAATLPVTRQFFALAKHGIGLARHSPTIHRVFVAAYVPLVRRVGIGKISGGCSTATRAVFLIRGRELPKLFAALDTGDKLAFSLVLAGTLNRTKTRLNTRIGFINPITVFASSLNHTLNYTVYRLAWQTWI